MADPSPTEPTEDRESEDDTGQMPDTTDQQDAATGEEQEEDAKKRTYPESYVRQLRREASGYRTRVAELDTRVAELEGKLQEHEDEGKSEAERLIDKATSAEQRALEAEMRLLRYEIATERGLDMDAARFLTGSTREEVEHRADELVKLLESRPKQSAGFDGGARLPAPPKGTPEEEHNDFLLRTLGRRGP